MRKVTTPETINRFMRELGSSVRGAARVYFTGGATAVMHGWREITIDINVRFSSELDELYRALPDLKEKLSVNVELASPPDFIPAQTITYSVRRDITGDLSISRSQCR